MIRLTNTVQQHVLLSIEFLRRGENLPSPDVVKKELQSAGMTIPLSQVEEVFRRLKAVKASPLQVSRLLRAVTGELPSARVADYYRNTAQRLNRNQPLPSAENVKMQKLLRNRQKGQIKPTKADWKGRIETFISHPFGNEVGLKDFAVNLRRAMQPPSPTDQRAALRMRETIEANPSLRAPIARALKYRELYGRLKHRESTLTQVGQFYSSTASQHGHKESAKKALSVRGARIKQKGRIS